MPLVGSLGNAAEVAYGPPSDFNPTSFDFKDIPNQEIPVLEPIDQNGNPTVLYTETKQITGVKSGLFVEINTEERVSSTGFVLDPNYPNIGYAITKEFPTDVTALTYTNVPDTILPEEYITLKLILEPSVPANDPSSFDKQNIFFNDYNPRFSSTILPESANVQGFNLTYETKLNVGQTEINWIVQTRDYDTTPLPFEFSGQQLNPPLDSTGAGTSTGSATAIKQVVYSENTATILGLETGYKFLLTIDPDFASISVDERVGLSTVEVGNGDIIFLKSKTPSGYSTSLNHTIEIGNFSTDWQIITEGINLDVIFTPENFTDLPFVAPSTPTVLFYDSDEITLSGFSPETTLPAQVSGTTTCFYQVEREVVGIGTTTIKNYEDADIEVQEGDMVKLRLQSSPGFASTETATFTVGNTSADWSITTLPEPT